MQLQLRRALAQGETWPRLKQLLDDVRLLENLTSRLESWHSPITVTMLASGARRQRYLEARVLLDLPMAVKKYN